MEAAVFHGTGDIRLDDRHEPGAGPDNLLVDVTYCAICGSDLKLVLRGNPRFKAGRIIGHEMVGTVAHVGEQLDGVEVSDRVTLATTIGCGECRYCGLGRSNLCEDAIRIGSDYDGAFATRILVPGIALRNGNVVRVPDDVPDEAAALSEPLSCAVNAQTLAGVSEGDTVLVVGGGPLGALHSQVARAKGAEKVMIVQRSEPRLSLLKELEGVTVIDGKKGDLAERVSDETGGLGVDVLMICAPSKEAHEQSVNLVRKGGTVSLFASLPRGESDVTWNSRTIHYGEIRVMGSSDSRPEHVREAVRLLAEGQVDTAPIVTHKMPLSEIHSGFELMKAKECLKVLIQPGA